MGSPKSDQVDLAYRSFADSGPGAIVLADLEERFGRNPFSPGQTDVTAFNCGAMAVLQHIGDRLRAADERERNVPVCVETTANG